MQLLLPIILLFSLCAFAHSFGHEPRISNLQNDASLPPKTNFVHLDHRQARSISAVKAVSNCRSQFRPHVVTTCVQQQGQQAAMSHKKQSPSLLKVIKDAISSMG